MNLILYPLLQTKSRKALLKTSKRFGHSYHYNPRGDLLERLSRQTGMTVEQVHDQLCKERLHLLKELGAIDTP